MRDTHSIEKMWNLLKAAGTNIQESDEELIKSFFGGENKAFDKLFAKNAKYTYHIINKAIAEMDDEYPDSVSVRKYFFQRDIENLICEIWDKLFEGLKNFRFESKFGTYLYIIAFRAAKKEIARVIKKEKKISIRLDEPIETEDGKWKPELPGFGKNPRERAYQKERKSLVRKAHQSLPEIHGKIIYFIYFRSYSYEEAASALNIPIGTVKSRLYRALNELKENLRKIGYEEYLQ